MEVSDAKAAEGAPLSQRKRLRYSSSVAVLQDVLSKYLTIPTAIEYCEDVKKGKLDKKQLLRNAGLLCGLRKIQRNLSFSQQVPGGNAARDRPPAAITVENG